MAVITKEIGSDARDYATFTLHEDALGGAAGGAGNDAVGEAYNDSAFDESVTYNDGTPDSVKITVPVGERHDGTEGTGARIVATAGGRQIRLDIPIIIEWLEFDHNGNISQALGTIRGVSSTGQIIANTILHGGTRSDGNDVRAIHFESMAADTPAKSVLNNIIYDYTHTGNNANDVRGIDDAIANTNRHVNILNNTIHDVQKTAGTGDAFGIGFTDGANRDIRNNIVTDTAGGTSGTTEDYEISSPANATAGYNLSSDATASDDGVTGNELINKASASQFVSNSAPYDLHIKTGADAIDAGVDLVTTPSGVEIDINGRDRDAEGDVWDMGAHELVAAAVTFVPQVIMI